MLAEMVLSQYRVSSSNNASPRIPLGARCREQSRIMWAAVCSSAPHSQFDVRARRPSTPNISTDRPRTRVYPFTNPRLLHSSDQMLAEMVLSQYRVSSSNNASPRIPLGARCREQSRIMWAAVCSSAPHSQFDVGARPHLCMDD